jgi:hypothetical protein
VNDVNGLACDHLAFILSRRRAMMMEKLVVKHEAGAGFGYARELQLSDGRRVSLKTHLINQNPLDTTGNQ